jgi:hypothetical protein
MCLDYNRKRKSLQAFARIQNEAKLSLFISLYYSLKTHTKPQIEFFPADGVRCEEMPVDEFGGDHVAVGFAIPA